MSDTKYVITSANRWFHWLVLMELEVPGGWVERIRQSRHCGVGRISSISKDGSVGREKKGLFGKGKDECFEGLSGTQPT